MIFKFWRLAIKYIHMANRCFCMHKLLRTSTRSLEARQYHSNKSHFHKLCAVFPMLSSSIYAQAVAQKNFNFFAPIIFCLFWTLFMIICGKGVKELMHWFEFLSLHTCYMLICVVRDYKCMWMLVTKTHPTNNHENANI